jgi:nitrate reductase assembly molybdenum cofactor insertion protein NarJ
MSVDIKRIADDVLSYVETSTKTAAAVESSTSELNTEVGQQLLKLAATLKTIDDLTPTNADLVALRMAKTASSDQTTETVVENSSTRGQFFRKLAHAVRQQGLHNEEQRAQKTAHMVNAAVGLQHLGGK